MSDSIWRATEADILRLAKSLGLVDDTTTEEAPPPEVEETPAPAVNARSSVEAVSRIRKQIDSIVIPDLADVCGVGRDQISVIVCPPDVELDWNDADVEAGMG